MSYSSPDFNLCHRIFALCMMNVGLCRFIHLFIFAGCQLEGQKFITGNHFRWGHQVINFDKLGQPSSLLSRQCLKRSLYPQVSGHIIHCILNYSIIEVSSKL